MALLVPGICGILCMLTNIPILQVSAFTTLMLCGVGPIVINTAIVEIYPPPVR